MKGVLSCPLTSEIFRQRRLKQATVAPGILLVFKFKMSSEANFVQFVRVLLGFRWWIKRLIRWPAATGIDDFLKSVLHSLQHFGMLVGDVIFFLLVFAEVEKC